MTATEKRIVTAMSVLAAITRFVPLSKSPWDWDEVLFSLGVRDYNVAMHHPHPPGFPLYVALGKLAFLFTDTEFHALQVVNVLFAIAVFPVMFRLARAFRLPFVTSLFAASLFAFLPNIWFYGGTAFSDIPAMLLFLAAIAAYLHDDDHYLLASLLLACAVLIRPQNALVAVYPWALATTRLLRAKRYRVVVAGSALLVVLVGIGYGSAMALSGGHAYVLALRGHGTQFAALETIQSADRPTLFETLRIQLDPCAAGKVSLLINALALIGLVFGRRRALDVFLTFGPFFTLALWFINPFGACRFSINYLAGFALLAAIGTMVIGEAAQRFFARGDLVVHAAVGVVLLGRLVTWVLPAFELPRKTDPPPVRAMLWLRDHTPPSSTIFIAHSIAPFPDYFLRGRTIVHVKSEEDVLRHPVSGSAWYVQMGRSALRDARMFERPKNRTWNIVAHRNFEASVVPTTSFIAFGDGWYEQEGEEHVWRWCAREGRIWFAPVNGKGELRLRLHVPLDVFRRPVRVTLHWNGTPLRTYTLRTEENDLRFVVDSRANAPNELRIETSDTFVPAHAGPSHDERELGLMLQSWEWRGL